MYSNDLDTCGMKCCYFSLHSEVNFLCVNCSQVSDSGLLGLLFLFSSGNKMQQIMQISVHITHPFVVNDNNKSMLQSFIFNVIANGDFFSKFLRMHA